MTFKEFMKEVGYDLMTTFWEDFSIADKYGIAGVKDTYKRAFDECEKVNPLYAFKVATAYFREQGKVPVFEDSNCRLIKL